MTTGMIHTKTSELSARLQQGDPVRLSFHYHSRDITRFINSMIIKLLANLDLLYLQGPVENILREMIVNAVKANSKRVFFQKMNMDISDDEQYRSGMENFKSFIVTEQEAIIADLKEQGYRVELIIKRNDEGFRVIVRNNVPLLPTEEERIRFRIEKARAYNDFSEIYCDIGDELEGEGLGIPLTVLFLRNSGLGEDRFSIISDGRVTQTAFTIPNTVQSVEIKTQVQQRILDEINELPSIPEFITEMQEMCRRSDVSIADLAGKISRDPASSAAVLKLANSGGFFTARRIESLHDAIMIIGLKNLHAILLAVSARKILDEHFSDFRDIWNHCNKTAFYARHIAEKYQLHAIADQVYLSSLLHDLGKIILLSIDSGLMDWITNVSIKKKMRTSTVIEEVSIGISHSTIGRLIAEKWHLPEYITDAISCHHSPLNASEKYCDVVFITYMADKMCLIEEGKFDFLFFEDEVLKRFNMNDEESFKNLHQELISQFESQPG